MLDDLVTALTSTGYQFAHFAWSKAPQGDYGVYAEDGENDFLVGNHHGERALTGTVDYFTRDASDAPRDTIEDALEASGVAWSLVSVAFEDDTGYIHLSWDFEAV